MPRRQSPSGGRPRRAKGPKPLKSLSPPPCHASSFPLLAQHDLSLFRPTGLRNLPHKHGPIWDFFFPPSAPVGRSLGAAGAGPRWRRRQRGFEIIAMATRVKTVLGRPGLGLHISSQLQQVGPNTGLDVSYDSRGQTGHCCTLSTSQNYCSETWSSVVAAINNQLVVSALLSVEVFCK